MASMNCPECGERMVSLPNGFRCDNCHYTLSRFQIDTENKWRRDEKIIRDFMYENAVQIYGLLYFFTANNERVEEVRALVDELSRRLDPALYRDRLRD